MEENPRVIGIEQQHEGVKKASIFYLDEDIDVMIS